MKPSVDKEPVVVVGSIGIDRIEVPSGDFHGVFGGSATHFACAARFFAPVGMVGCVGDDVPGDWLGDLRNAGISLEGVSVLPGKTFRWHGRYNEDMSIAETVELEFGVMEGFIPRIPGDWRSSRYVFLANSHPEVQMRVFEQIEAQDAVVVCDTIRHWISGFRDAVLEVVRRCRGVIINDEEVRLLTGRGNLLDAAEALLGEGVEFAVVKKGEHGALLACRDGLFPLPAYPVRGVVDPTGAGDSFAGGFMGTLRMLDSVDPDALRKAVVSAVVVSSFNVEGVGPAAVLAATVDDVRARVDAYRNMLRF